MNTDVLDHAGIEALVPHRGTMCLLDRLVAWDEARIECIATGHRDPGHPLRSRSGLMAGAASVAALLTLVTIGLVNALVWYGRLHYRLLKPALEPQVSGGVQ